LGGSTDPSWQTVDGAKPALNVSVAVVVTVAWEGARELSAEDEA